MVPLPPLHLEEEGEEAEEEGGQDASPSSSRSHPHLLARRFLDFGAHSAQRFLQQDLDATSPTKAQRYDEQRASVYNPSIIRPEDVSSGASRSGIEKLIHTCVSSVPSGHVEHRLAPKRR